MSKWIEITKFEDLKKVPQIFNAIPHASVSDRYEMVHTIDVLEAAKRLGWTPKFASGVGDNPYGFHAVKLEHKGYKIMDGDNIQLIISNSHDRTRAFKVNVGVYRLVCSNGLVIPIVELLNLRQLHIGFDSSELIEQLNQTIESLDLIIPKIEEMGEIPMGESERENFAFEALLTRLESEHAETVDLYQLLQAKRPEDEGDDLWTTLNVLQEKIINGDYKYEMENKWGEMVLRKGRAINGFKTDLELNQKLFTLANQYMEPWA